MLIPSKEWFEAQVILHSTSCNSVMYLRKLPPYEYLTYCTGKLEQCEVRTMILRSATVLYCTGTTTVLLPVVALPLTSFSASKSIFDWSDAKPLYATFTHLIRFKRVVRRCGINPLIILASLHAQSMDNILSRLSGLKGSVFLASSVTR